MASVLASVLAGLLLLTAAPDAGATTTCANVTVDEILSYHLHIVFLNSNTESTVAAFALGGAFEARFAALGASDECPFHHTDPSAEGYKNMTAMCKFSHVNDGDGEFVFVAANYAYFVPPSLLGEATAFAMWAQHDYVGDYVSLFLHQNSGCQDRDHLYSPLRGVQVRGTSSVPVEVDGEHLCCRDGLDGVALTCGSNDNPGDCPTGDLAARTAPPPSAEATAHDGASAEEEIAALRARVAVLEAETKASGAR